MRKVSSSLWRTVGLKWKLKIAEQTIRDDKLTSKTERRMYVNFFEV